MSSLLVVVEDMKTLLRLQLLSLLVVGGHRVNAYRLDGKWEGEEVVVASHQLDSDGFSQEDDSSWESLAFYTNPQVHDSGHQAQQPPWVPQHLEPQNQLKLHQHDELPSYQQPQHPKVPPQSAKHIEVTNYPQLPWYPQHPIYYSPQNPENLMGPYHPPQQHQQPQHHEGPEGMFLFQQSQQPKTLRYQFQIPGWSGYLPQDHQYPWVQNVPDYSHHHQHCPQPEKPSCMPQPSQQPEVDDYPFQQLQQPEPPERPDYLPEQPGFPQQQPQHGPSNLQQQAKRIRKPRYSAQKSKIYNFDPLRPPMLRFPTKLRH